MTGLVQPFISTVMGSLDSKGRVCIPAAYRHILAAQNTAGVYICPSFSEPALEAFGQTLLDSVRRGWPPRIRFSRRRMTTRRPRSSRAPSCWWPTSRAACACPMP